MHTATISAAVRDSSGNLVMEATLETKAETILEFVHGRPLETCFFLTSTFIELTRHVDYMPDGLIPMRRQERVVDRGS